MEKCFDMTIDSTQLNIVSNSVPIKGSGGIDESFIIEAHNSNNMKLERPKVSANNILTNLPAKKTFSDKEASAKLKQINQDIYQGTKKEKSKYEFNLKRYFTIFGVLALATAIITYFRRGRG